VRELEANPIFNSGFGARLQSDGIARLSCALMDGAQQRMASVANVECQKHPSRIARRLLQERDRNLASTQASQFALSQGFAPQSVVCESRYHEFIQKSQGKSGTVGAVVLDANRQTAACTSTGGRGFERPGRISDSFTPAGNFASPFGAVSCTGVGEEILEASVASSIMTRVEDGIRLAEAVERTFARQMEKTFGMIALTQRGEACVYATRGALAFLLICDKGIFPGLLPEDWSAIPPALNKRHSSSKAKGLRRNFQA
jgi:L-asparaginase